MQCAFHFTASLLRDFEREKQREAVVREREERMGRKLGLDRMLDCFSLSVCANACVCIHAVEDEDEENEGKALVSAQLDELLKLKDFGGGAKTLAFHLEPKVRKN